MSLSHSPKIVTDGLVLYYDMNNTKKSWKGAPTVNLVTNPTYEANPNATGNEFVQWGDIAPIFDTYGTTGIVYSLSFDLKSKIAGPIRVYMQNGSATKYAFVNQDVTATTEYQRFTINGLSASIQTPTETLAKLAFYGTYGTGRIASIKNVQIQINAFATPFINGTRTDTQALVDLTNTNTLTATSLTYASDNTFSFNGTTDYIDCGSSPSIKPTGALTVSTWINFSALVANNRVLSDWHQSGDAGDRWIFYVPSATTIQWYIHTVGTTDVGISYTPALNTWINLVGTYDGTAMYLYANGILVSQVAKTGTMSAGVGYTARIGRQAEIGSSHSGYISITKIYNRALSAAEVSQNFNALRGRYGI